MAGSFYIGFERDDKLPGLRKDAEIATKDIDRVAAAYAHLYFPNGVKVAGDPEADPPVPDSVRAPTGEEVFSAMADGLLRGILDNTLNVEKAAAAQSAQGAVPDIPVAIG